MLFKPYSPTDAKAVSELLNHHIDYAPDTIEPDRNTGNKELFDQFYIDEQTSGYDFIAVDDDTGAVRGFMQLDRREVAGAICWFVTQMFVENAVVAEDIAVFLITAFENTLTEAKELCIVIHPGDAKIVAFWESKGFAMSPERSIFSNTKDQRLFSYRKLLTRA